jgi:hypothetical protein
MALQPGKLYSSCITEFLEHVYLVQADTVVLIIFNTLPYFSSQAG